MERQSVDPGAVASATVASLSGDVGKKDEGIE